MADIDPVPKNVFMATYLLISRVGNNLVETVLKNVFMATYLLISRLGKKLVETVLKNTHRHPP